MAKSELAVAMDELQASLSGMIRRAGFRKIGRTYNRVTSDGLTHVIKFQMGSFDPPGTTYVTGLQENLYGRFAVNLGVYIPEVARDIGGGAKSIVHDYNCSIRTRLGRAEGRQEWWKIMLGEQIIAELNKLLQNEALPFFERFECRDQILAEFRGEADNTSLMDVPRIVCAVILLNRGDREEARRLLAAQAKEHTRNPAHPVYVMNLARRLGVNIKI